MSAIKRGRPKAAEKTKGREPRRERGFLWRLHKHDPK